MASGFPTLGGNNTTDPGAWTYAHNHWDQVQAIRALLLLHDAWDQPRSQNWDLTDYSATVWFQEQKGIVADGIVGTVTYNHLLNFA